MLSLLTAVTLAAALLAGQNAVGNIGRRQNPALALSVVPDEPVALTFIADRQFIASQTPASLNKVELMARHALTRQPLNASAVRLLGYVEDTRGQKERARKLVTSAAGLSRREFGSQLWLIEDAVAKDDIAGALRHYDIALRSTVSSQAILIPTLTGALGDPRVRKGLVPYVGQAADWVPAFLADAITNGGNPADVADILIRTKRLPSDEQYQNIVNSLLGKLAENGMFNTFRELYLSLPGSRSATLNSVGLSTNTVALKYPSAGWSMNDYPAAGGRFSEPSKNGAISASVFAGSGERQELMRKYTFYKPGRYRFSASYHAAQTATDAQIVWDFHCMSAKGNTRVWLLIAPVNKGSATSTQEFSIPANCPNQQLIFSLTGGIDQTGAELVLKAMSVKPI